MLAQRPTLVPGEYVVLARHIDPATGRVVGKEELTRLTNATWEQAKQASAELRAVHAGPYTVVEAWQVWLGVEPGDVLT